MQDTIIKNAAVVLKDRVLDSASVWIRGNRIQEISEKPGLEEKAPHAKQIDAAGAYLMPGFIDIHSDNIETVIQPRPQSLIDFELAMREQEKQLVNQGITTMYHSLSIIEVGNTNDQSVFKKGMVRTPENLKKLVGLIRTFHEGDHLIRHRFHCRYDITNTKGYDMVLDFIRNGDVHLLSFMDHTPGQGQYRDLELFKNNVLSPEQSDAEKEEILSQRMSRAKLTAEQMTRAADMAAQAGIPIASHDDDSIRKAGLRNPELACANLRVSGGAFRCKGGAPPGYAGRGGRDQCSDGALAFQQPVRARGNPEWLRGYPGVGLFPGGYFACCVPAL